MLGRREESLVGLDIGASAVKLVELHRRGDACRMVAAGAEPLPPDCVLDGAIADVGVVSDAIRRLLRRLKINTKAVAVSLSGHAVIVKKIVLPPMPETELRDAIQWEARQHIPFDSQDVTLDYQVMETLAGDGKQDLDVLLVAAKKEKVQDYLHGVSQAGCVPQVLDIDAFALQNAYELNYGIHPTRVVVLVNVGASTINLNVVRGAQSVFTRDVAIGGNAYSEAIQRETGLDFEDADRLKRGISTSGVAFEEAEPIIRAVTQNVLQEVSKTLDFFRATAVTDHFDSLVLSGGTSRLDGMADALADRFDADVEPLDPFRRITVDEEVLTAEQRLELAPVASVAVGLALRRAEDR